MKKTKTIKAWAITSKREGICQYGNDGGYHIYPDTPSGKFFAERKSQHFNRHKVVPIEIKIKQIV